VKPKLDMIKMLPRTGSNLRINVKKSSSQATLESTAFMLRWSYADHSSEETNTSQTPHIR